MFDKTVIQNTKLETIEHIRTGLEGSLNSSAFDNLLVVLKTLYNNKLQNFWSRNLIEASKSFEYLICDIHAKTKDIHLKRILNSYIDNGMFRHEYIPWRVRNSLELELISNYAFSESREVKTIRDALHFLNYNITAELSTEMCDRWEVALFSCEYLNRYMDSIRLTCSINADGFLDVEEYKRLSKDITLKYNDFCNKEDFKNLFFAAESHGEDGEEEGWVVRTNPFILDKLRRMLTRLRRTYVAVQIKTYNSI